MCFTEGCYFISDYPQFAPFSSFPPPPLGYPLPGYTAAAAAASAAYTAAAQQQQQQQPGKPPRNTERSRPNFAYTYPSIPSTCNSCSSISNILYAVSSIYIYIWTENSKSKMAEIEELLDVKPSPFLLFLFAQSNTKLPGVCRNFVF